MRISDLKGIFKTSILTIESIENEYEDYYTIKMIPEKNLDWSPGEHGIFKLLSRKAKGRKWRVFSVASVPGEGFMLIGTRTGEVVSYFKKELISMEKGDILSIRGPFGWFKVQDSTSPMVMVAAGVGITPVRSIIKQLEKDRSRSIELIYTASDFHLFEDELQSITLDNNKLTIHLVYSKEETNTVLANLIAKYKDEAYYFLSGSPSFIQSIKKQIKDKGIKGKRIINDPFIGY
ncbi:MAG: FAD-dependent oxidoreductase [Clostridium sp.]|nr:FAD-dependent oxidoreductase [Clostridium sp.]